MEGIVVPLIVVISYIFGELYKLVFKKYKELNSYIPIFVSITGGLVAVLIYLVDVKLFDVSSIFEALLLGLIAGASSTGTNQIIKKVFRSNNYIVENKEEEK